VVVLGAWLIAGSVQLLRAADEARAGRDLLEEARDTLEPRDFLEGSADPLLRAAEGRFAAARHGSESVLTFPLRALPVAGRQVRSLETLAGAAEQLLVSGGAALDEVGDALDEGWADSARRPAVLRDVAATLGRARTDLDEIDLGPSEALVGPLAAARNTLEQELDSVRDLLDRAGTTSTGLSRILSGRRYLLLAANNAEMQAGWGMPLSAGLLTIEDGEFAVDEMVPTSELRLPESVELPRELAGPWGWLNPGREWRNVAVTPRFDVAGPHVARMWEAAGGQPVDGVLAVDPEALAELLRATGPIEVDGRRIGADDVVEYLLHGQYEGLGPDDQEDRRDRLSAVTRAALGSLDDDLDAITLAEGLIEAVGGRHLLAWSPRPGDQQAWEAAGADGSLQPDSLLVSLVNRGANKLDWFVEVDASLEVGQTADGRILDLAVEVTNSGPTEASYVAGPQPATGAVEPGDYVGILTVHAPRDSRLLARDGGAPSVAGRQGPVELFSAALLRLPAGSSQRVVFRLALPDDLAEVTIEPDGRVHPVRWRVGEVSWADGRSRTLALAPPEGGQ
jgi:hypothetical protein